MLMFLMSGADGSDNEKIKYLYNRFHEEMLRIAEGKFRKSGSFNPTEDAEDAVQCAFWRVAKWISKIDFNRTDKEIRNYLMSILFNEINTILKKFPKKILYCENYDDVLYDTEYNFPEELEIKQKYDRVVEEIARMNDIYSITMMYIYVEEMSVKEVAKIMGVTEKTVYTRLERGKQILRKALEGEIYE